MSNNDVKLKLGASDYDLVAGFYNMVHSATLLSNSVANHQSTGELQLTTSMDDGERSLAIEHEVELVLTRLLHAVFRTQGDVVLHSLLDMHWDVECEFYPTHFVYVEDADLLSSSRDGFYLTKLKQDLRSVYRSLTQGDNCTYFATMLALCKPLHRFDKRVWNADTVANGWSLSQAQGMLELCREVSLFLINVHYSFYDMQGWRSTKVSRASDYGAQIYKSMQVERHFNVEVDSLLRGMPCFTYDAYGACVPTKYLESLWNSISQWTTSLVVTQVLMTLTLSSNISGERLSLVNLPINSLKSVLTRSYTKIIRELTHVCNASCL